VPLTSTSAASTQTQTSASSADAGPWVNEASGERSNNAAGAFQSPWRGEWAHPLFRMLPAMPINGLPDSHLPTSNQPPSASASAPLVPELEQADLTDVDSRVLLERWLAATGSKVLPLEDELTRRGFGRLSARLVQQLFSTDADERLRLVDAVLTEPGVDARPWLILLADDTDADVRLLAVTIMATSDDSVLIEKAWQVAINDRDPRIAGMAGRLRDRRDSAKRR
jgi:hypothetical protein